MHGTHHTHKAYSIHGEIRPLHRVCNWGMRRIYIITVKISHLSAHLLLDWWYPLLVLLGAGCVLVNCLMYVHYTAQLCPGQVSMISYNSCGLLLLSSLAYFAWLYLSSVIVLLNYSMLVGFSTQDFLMSGYIIW